MNRDSFENVKNYWETKDEPIIKGCDLKNQLDRTLLYGYLCGGETWHVYLKNGVIYTVVYAFDGSSPSKVTVESNQHYVPDKRLNPERCDEEFCLKLKYEGARLSFTTFQDDIEGKQYYGKIL